MTSTVETPCASWRWRTRSTRGTMGSASRATSACIRASRIIRFVAEVSSSRSSRRDPASSASTSEAAWLVLPLAFSVVKASVERPPGSSRMKGRTSTERTGRPSSARTVTASARVAERSRPSPGRWGYTAAASACSSVDLPW